jgi:hypothetical protein
MSRSEDREDMAQRDLTERPQTAVHLATHVARPDWADTLVRFTRAHRGRHVGVEVLDGRGLHATLVRDATLRRIAQSQDDVVVMFEASSRAESVDIVAPTKLELHRSCDGSEIGVDVATHDGRWFRLRFLPPVPPSAP